jgi:hypothetical protein
MSIATPLVPTWAEVDRGFFVASTDGVFLGSVDRTTRGRFIARNGQAAQIGIFKTFTDAQRAVLDDLL